MTNHIESLLTMTAPTREDFSIPYHDLGPKDSAPSVALVGGIHGNEVNGVFVLARLASFLRSVLEDKQQGYYRLNKRVVIIPAVNLLGLNLKHRVWPFDKTDINRMFPGHSEGETTQRIAYRLITITKDAYYKIDIHSSNSDFEEHPQIRLYGARDNERNSAALFGLSAVIELDVTGVFTSTLGHAWRWYQGENFIIQAGQAGSLQLHHCQRLFQAIINFLIRKDILSGPTKMDQEEDVHFFGLNQTLPLISEDAGFFVSNLPLGRWLRPGETIGFVYDSFQGHIKTEIKSPVAGLLSGLRKQPLLCEGDLIARIQSTTPLSDAVNTYLYSHAQ